MKRPVRLSHSSLLWCVVAAALGLGGGWLIHRARPARGGDGSRVEGSGSTVGVATSRDGRPPTAVAAGAGKSDDDALATALANSPRIERWLLLVAAAEKATPAQMPGLLRLCHGDGTALRMVAARWAELDPRHMWQTLLVHGAKGSSRVTDSSGLGLPTNELARLLFESWTPRDPAAARAALTAAKGFPGIENLRMNVLEPMMRSDPETALRLMKEWNVRHWYPRLEELGAWAAKDPARAAAVVRDCGTGVGALKAMETVGKAWARTDPAAALAFASALPPTQRSPFAAGAITQWAADDLRAAAAYVTGLSDAALRATLALPLVEAWAKGAPQQALDWAQESLRGEARAAAIGGLVGAIAREDITRAAGLVGALDAGGSKNKAISSLVDQWFQKSGAAPVAEWLLGLPEADARDAGFEKLGWQWMMQDSRAAAALATGPQRDLVPASFTTQVAINEARRDPEAAMQWIDQLPPSRIAQTRDLILGEWMRARPEAAARWVLDRPEGDNRRDLVASATRHLAWASSPEAARKFLDQLPAADRAAAREALRATQLPIGTQRSFSEALGE